MLSVANKPFMLSVFMLNVVILIVVMLNVMAASLGNNTFKNFFINRISIKHLN
jgi:hypothetical protein